MKAFYTLVTAVLTATFGGCGGPNKATTNPDLIRHAEAPDTREGDLTGTLSEEDIRRVFDEQADGFQNCFRQVGATFVSGEVQLTVTVKANGRVERAFVTRSDLGELTAEECLADTAGYLEFPPPAGGKARFAYPLRWNEPGRRLSSPTEVAWGYQVLAHNRQRFQDCRDRYTFRGPFTLTTYVGRMGLVLHAGYDGPVPAASEFPGCVVGLLKSLRFPNPGERVFKYRVTVEELNDDVVPMNREY